MAGGYVTAYIPITFARSPMVQMFYSGQPGPGFTKELMAFCAAYAVRVVILANGAQKKWDSTLANTGWERLQVDGVIMYRVPKM
jgi:hypothetical protein